MNNYIQVDQQLHRLCQIIAKVNRTFIKKKPDDSHTNLGFNHNQGRIEGRWIETEKGKIRLILRLADVCFVWMNEREESVQTVSTAKKSIEEIESQLKKGLEESGLDGSDFQAPMHYEMPEYSFSDQPVSLLSRLALNEWVHWRSIANEACQYLINAYNRKEEIRIWPHHFDTGIYMDLNNGLGIGFGLAMKDTMVGAPYFYATCYPDEGIPDYSDTPDLGNGRWIVQQWHGAVLSLQDLQSKSKPVAKAEIQQFINETMGWYNQK